MDFSIDRSPLLEALQNVQTIVEKKNTFPILGNILCTVVGNELSLCATDLEVGIKAILPVEAKTDGKITLSAKHFLDIVKELPDRKLHLTRKDNNWVELNCGKSRFNIVSLPAEQFPALPVFEDKNYLDCKSAALMEMIDRTQFAASADATRYHINGVFFERLESGMMRMAATDGHRLSFVDQEVFLNAPEQKRGVIIPKKGLTELRKLLSESTPLIGLAFERGHLFVKLDNCYLFIRLIDGEYPDYRPVFPKDTNQILLVNRQDYSSALKRVSLLANEKSRAIRHSLKDGCLVLSSSNSEMGEAREEVDILYSGDAMEIGFNSKYLLECLAVMKAEQLEFRLKDRLSPGVLKEAGSDSHHYVIMPMRI